MRHWLVLLLVLPALAVTDDEIARAVQQLGAPKHADREQAQQFLWQAADAARPALESAAQSTDPEISERARAILSQLKLGIRPDTPPELRALIERFHAAGSDEVRQAVVADLFALGDKAEATITNLVGAIPDLDRRTAIFLPALEPFVESFARIQNRDQLTEADVSQIATGMRYYNAIAPEDIAAPLQVIVALDRAGKTKEADAIFERTLAGQKRIAEKSPKSADAHNNIAWLCAVTRRQLNLALTHSRLATELSPKTPAYLDTLAEIHFQKGDRQKAGELIAECIKLAPETEYFQKQRDRFATGKPEEPPPDLEMLTH